MTSVDPLQEMDQVHKRGVSLRAVHDHRPPWVCSFTHSVRPIFTDMDRLIVWLVTANQNGYFPDVNDILCFSSVAWQLAFPVILNFTVEYMLMKRGKCERL